MGFRNKRIKSCPFANRRCYILIDDSLYEQMVECVNLLDHEFILYLVGRREDNTVYVNGVNVPSQVVSAASAEAEDIFLADKHIGIAHSHHNLGAFHSATDEEGADNAPVSIVMSRTGWCAKVAHRMPCGRWGLSQNVVISPMSKLKGDDGEEKQHSVSEYELGDCPSPDAPECGIIVRRNPVLQQIRLKSRERRYHASKEDRYSWYFPFRSHD